MNRSTYPVRLICASCHDVFRRPVHRHKPSRPRYCSKTCLQGSQVRRALQRETKLSISAKASMALADLTPGGGPLSTAHRNQIAKIFGVNTLP